MKERTVRSYVNAGLNKELGNDSISQFGVSQITRIQADIQRAQDSREFSGLLIGIVKENEYTQPDTKQPIRGVIKVYLPSSGRIMETRTGDKEEDASGWYTCYPILPFAGSAVNGSSEGNSHGFDYAPSIDTAVAVLMADANTKTAFWFGCLPTVPGMNTGPGAETNKVKDEKRPGVGMVSNKKEKPKPTIQENIKEAGLVADPDRGPTPQTDRSIKGDTVFAIRSKGDPKKNKIGHQLVMVDDENYRHVRMRTTEGNQVLLSDANGCIYLNTKHGKSYLELRDDGDVFVYAEKSVSFHAKEDVNIYADRDFNLDVGRDFNMRVKEDFKFEIGKGYHANVIGQHRVKVGEDIHWDVTGKSRLKTGGDAEVKAGGKIRHDAGGALHIKAASNIKINSNVRVDTQAGAESAESPEGPEEVKLATVPGPPKPEEYREGKGGADVQVLGSRDSKGSNSNSGSSGGGNNSGPKVPQHEPWDPVRSSSASYDNQEQTGKFNAPDRDKVAGLKWNNGDTPQIASSTNVPLGWKNNNPGAVQPNDRSLGKVGSDGAVAKFQDMKYGFAAQTRAWDRAMRPDWTPKQVACYYINGNPDSTAQSCTTAGSEYARAAGVDPDTPLTEEQIKDPDFRYNWQKRAACWENGIDKRDFEKWFDPQDLSDGLAMQGIKRENTGQEVGDEVDAKGPSGQPTRGRKQTEKGSDYRAEQRKLLGRSG